MKENVHGGHRERQRQKFRAHGLESFTDVEALELLLYYAIPRRETNTLAHALLERFGSFRGVMEADAAELAAVPGIGESAATLLRLVTALNQRYLGAARSFGIPLADTAAVCAYLMPKFAYCSEEIALLVTLDSASRLIRCHRLAEGLRDKIVLSSRDIVALALRDQAVKVILAHNHVSGVALPSSADIRTTDHIRSALALISVELVDHIIVCDNDCVSMRDSGWPLHYGR
jgi:DNA repair protein RadC